MERRRAGSLVLVTEARGSRAHRSQWVGGFSRRTKRGVPRTGAAARPGYDCAAGERISPRSLHARDAPRRQHARLHPGRHRFHGPVDVGRARAGTRRRTVERAPPQFRSGSPARGRSGRCRRARLRTLGYAHHRDADQSESLALANGDRAGRRIWRAPAPERRDGREEHTNRFAVADGPNQSGLRRAARAGDDAIRERSNRQASMGGPLSRRRAQAPVARASHVKCADVAKKKTVRRRKRVGAKSVGLSAPETAEVNDAETRALAERITDDGGAVLGTYREPFGGTPAVFAALPIDRVEPTPYQRDPSLPHVKRLMHVIETLGRFLDPMIVVPADDGYLTPNGNHRLQAMRKLGAKSVVALVVPDRDVAFKILALNTEKAHNLKEKSLETIRMLRALADERTTSTEREFAFEFDQPAFLTLGAAYEQRPRLSGGAYHPVLRRIDDFLDERLPKALKERMRRAELILDIDAQVGAI